MPSKDSRDNPLPLHISSPGVASYLVQSDEPSIEVGIEPLARGVHQGQARVAGQQGH